MSWEQDMRLGRDALSESLYDVAEMRLRSALATASSEFWYPTEELAEIQTLLAEALLLKGRYAEAKPLFEQSEKFFLDQGESVEGIVRAMNWFGLAEINFQQLETANIALELFKKSAPFLLHGTGHRQLFHKRAIAFVDETGDAPPMPWEKAEMERLAQIRQVTESIVVCGELPQDVMAQLVEWEGLLEKSRNCLAKETPEDVLEGYKLANQALGLATRLFPLHHGASAYSMTVMASASGAMRMLGQAEDLYTVAIEIHEMISGKKSMEAGLTRLNFAHLYRKAELFEEADVQFRMAAEILSRNHEVNQDEFQRHSSMFCDMLAAWRTAQEACLLIQHGKELELAQKLDAALISLIKAKRMLSEKFPDEHKICLIVREAIMQVYEKLGWHEDVAKVSREIETIKNALDDKEIAWKKVATAAPPLAIAKKAA
jgi:tetratricopeptide (TPR) repeat protein